MARVADALPAVGFYWPIVSASDHPASAPVHELLASFSGTVKHVQTETVVGAPMARAAVEMARVEDAVAAELRRIVDATARELDGTRSGPGSRH